MLKAKEDWGKRTAESLETTTECATMSVPYPVVNELECKACGRCVTACPTQVLSMGEDINDRGYHFVIYAGEGCIGCGNCFYSCPEPLALEVHIPRKK